MGVVRAGASKYCEVLPFEPAQLYPETPWPVSPSGVNPAYDAVRRLFRLLGFDAANFSTPRWNPLGWLIQPADTVVLKPNLIGGKHPRDPGGWRYMITHGSVIRAVADYVCIALKGEGRVVVCDAPQTDSNFGELCRRTGLDRLVGFYRGKGVRFHLVDLRHEEWVSRHGAIVARKMLRGDPAGTLVFDLGKHSELFGHPGNGRYYGADYDSKQCNSYHTRDKHEYPVSRTIMEADVFINLPKLKTHKKAGITCALKNLVGINTDKNWLPHYTEGVGPGGGDEYPEGSVLRSLERAGLKALRRFALAHPSVGGRLLQGTKVASRPVFGGSSRVVRAGNWYGNDTVWRMCLDLNRVLFVGSPDGTLRPPTQSRHKRYLALVDGILAGEGNGPIDPDPVPAGLVLGGTNPVAVDAAAAVLMGFDPDKIPIIANGFKPGSYALAGGNWRDVELISDLAEWQGCLGEIDPSTCLRFKPHFGWAGHIERVPLRVTPAVLGDSS